MRKKSKIEKKIYKEALRWKNYSNFGIINEFQRGAYMECMCLLADLFPKYYSLPKHRWEVPLKDIIK